MDSSDSDSLPVTQRLKRKKTLSTSSSSSSGSLDEGQRQMLRRRRKRRRREEVIESSSDSDVQQVEMSVSESSSSNASEQEFEWQPRSRRLIAPPEEERNTPRQARTVASMRNVAGGGSGQVAPDAAAAVVPAVEAATAGYGSDSSGEEGATGEKCSVCLRRIRAQEIGSPECCDHTFCLGCLVTWSKSCNQCPLDRRPFRLILVRENLQGPVTRQLPVEERAQPVVFDEIDMSFCMICGDFDREEQMLLCDGCDRGFHIDCLTPPLAAVPEVDEWFCPTCEAWQMVTAETVARAASREDAVGRRPRRVQGPTVAQGRNRLRMLTSHPLIFLPRLSHRTAQRIDDSLHQLQMRAPTPSSATLAPSEEGPSTSGTQPNRRPRKRVVKKTTRKVKKRKTVKRRYVTKKKKIFVENDDGTVTEEIVSVKTKVTRRRKRKTVKKKRKTTRRRGSSRASGACGASHSTRGRLERTLAATVAGAPSSLLPDTFPCRRASPAVASNLSRFSAGIPTLNIFGPRHELAPVSSGSDEEIGGGGVGLLSRGRSARPRPIERSKAIELLRSAPARPRIAPQPCEGPSDLLSSILESQTIWHSKRPEVTIRNDGSVEPCTSSRVDVRNTVPERVATAAPIFPGSGGGAHRPSGDNRTSPGSSQSRPSAPSTAAASSGPRVAAPYNDREGYTNFLTNLSSRPAPFCRGGPPLRIRMPARPQLRRIPLLPRRNNRALYDEEEEEDQPAGKKEDEEEGEADKVSSDANDGDMAEDAGPKQGEQELDLYSDIEPNAEREGSESEAATLYAALGPPPEPPAFLLDIAAGEDKNGDKNDSEVYDPAEPCDSEDELVIDETRPAAPAAVPPLPPPPMPPAALNDALNPPDESAKLCPVLQLYSSDSVAFSHRDEDERANALPSRNDADQLSDSVATSSVPVDEVPQETGITDSEDAHEKDDATADVDKDKDQDRSPSLVRDSSSSPSSSLSRGRRSPSHSPSPKRTKKDSTHSRNSRSSSTFSTSRRKRRSIDKDDSSDDNDKSPRPSRKFSENQDSQQNDNEQSANYDHPRVSTGLEGLEVEEVSSDMEENDFNESRLSSLSLSGISDQSRSSSPTRKKKKKKKRTKSRGRSKKTASEEGEIESDKEKTKKPNKRDRKASDADRNGINASKRRSSKTRSPNRKVLSSQENKKIEDKEAWKKMPKRGRNYRESRKSSKERGLSSEKKRDASSSPKRDKKKSKDKKKSDKKKEIERYDVRKIVKEKEHVRKDEFGRDLAVRSPGGSRSKSRSRSHGRGRPPARKQSRSPSPPPPARRRSPSRRRRRRRSASRSPLSPRPTRRMRRSSDRDGMARKASRSPRRNRTNVGRSRKSLSRSISLSPAPRAREGYSPVRVNRRSISPAPIRSFVKAWSPNREKSLENLTVVLKSKEKKKRKKKKDERRERKSFDGKRKKSGNSKEVFASGDNVLVSVNFSNKSNKSNVIIVSPDLPLREVSSKKKKKRMANDDGGRPVKKNRTGNAAAVTKSAIDSALSSEGLAKRKKLGRLTEEDAEEILKRKPVAVIDLDMSPYREQTPSPINVVVVSDSGSGDEDKAPGPGPGKQQQRPRSPEITVLPTPAMLTITGPKTPPEPPLKFAISKPAQIRPIANPLAEPDDEPEEPVMQNESQVIECVEVMHKGPNTPPEPRGPATPPMVGPNTPQSPQSSPDAYDPFEPTKSRSPSPARLAADAPVDKTPAAESCNLVGTVSSATSEDAAKHTEPADSVVLESPAVNNVSDVNSAKEIIAIDVVELVATPSSTFNKTATARRLTPQPMTPNAVATLQTFSLPSPKTPNRTNSSVPVSGIQRLQHRLGSPVSKTPNSVKSTPEKRSNDTLAVAAPRVKRNGPVPDGSNETVDMDDSPYSPGSSEGDDLFDPPPAASLPPPAPAAHKPVKPKTSTTPVKAANKFDLLFGPSGPNISPLKNGAKKPGRMAKGALPKASADKKAIKPAPAKKGQTHKMDEDQLRILDEVPSSAVELQVKDKYLKKLNRQERVVDEVKTVLKPHYAQKHISKEEYKQILRRAVPKICHSKSGEINPSKIQHLVEAYVKKYMQNKREKKASSGFHKPAKKSGMFS